MLDWFYKKLKKASQFLKFFFIGGFFALADLALLYIFTDIFGWFYLHSAIVGFFIVTSLAFFVHKHVTFRCKREDRLRQYLSFFLINVIGLGIYSGFLYVWVDTFWFFYLFVAIVAKFIVFLWNFFANKYITFRIHV